jgi:predicted transcriptional regulator
MNKVKDLMTKRVITIPEDMVLEQICKILYCNSLSGVPVVDNKNKLIGFVSERDIVGVISSGSFQDKKAKDIMRKDIITVKEDMLLTQVSKIFADRPFRHLPVLKKGEIVGIISRKDVLGKFLKID